MALCNECRIDLGYKKTGTDNWPAVGYCDRCKLVTEILPASCYVKKEKYYGNG